MSQNKRNGRRFGLTMAGAGIVFAALMLYLNRPRIAAALGLAAFFFAAFALVKPVWLEPVEAVWMSFARILGAVNTTIIMSVLYLLVFVPVSFVLRMLGRDSMRRRWPAGADSGWVDYRAHQQDERHYERMY